MFVTIVGFIGSGNVGSTVARLAVAAGHEVVMSNSRDPDTLRELVADLGPMASAATAESAAEQGEIVVVSAPLRVYRGLPVGPLAGKAVMDTNNYRPERDGHIPELDDDSSTGSEVLQRHLESAHVVKVFNNISCPHLAALARPHGAPDRSALPIAGDSDSAKALVAEFLDSIGYDTVDAGPLGAGGRRFQVDSPAYGALYGPLGGDAIPAGVEEVRAVLGRS